MKEIAQKLKAAREQKGLTLQQIHEKTRISIKYLEALEEGRFSETPGEVYLKGFLRSFAEEVGLDPEAVLAEYRTLKLQAENPAVNVTGTGETTAAPGTAAQAAGPATVAAEPPKPKQVKEVSRVQFTAIMVAAVFILSGLTSSLISAFFAKHEAPEGAHLESVATVEHETAPGEEPAVEATTSEPAAPVETPVAPEPVSQGITVDLSVTLGRCWTKVQVDGKDAYEGTLSTGNKQNWKAEKEVRVTLGNPGAVKLVFNGQPVTNLGEDVVYLSFTSEGMKRLRISQ